MQSSVNPGNLLAESKMEPAAETSFLQIALRALLQI